MHDIAGEELVPIIKEARERFNDASCSMNLLPRKHSDTMTCWGTSLSMVSLSKQLITTLRCCVSKLGEGGIVPVFYLIFFLSRRVLRLPLGHAIARHRRGGCGEPSPMASPPPWAWPTLLVCWARRRRPRPPPKLYTRLRGRTFEGPRE